MRTAVPRSGILIPGLILATVASAEAQDPAAFFQTFGVPASPAFELLPNKPSEVTHIATASDIQASIAQFVVDSKLGTSAAVDMRPLAFAGGTLSEYQRSLWKRLAWRTVLGAGVAPAGDQSGDVFTAVGLRIPILDRGDPRMDTTYLRSLLDAVMSRLDQQPPNPDSVDHTWVEDRLRGSAREDSVRAEWSKRHWNAERLEVGFAASGRVLSGALARDSILGDRLGVWLAYARGIGSWAELTLSAKTAGVRADSATSESRRDVVGARLRIRPISWLAFAGEGAQIWSHRQADSTKDWTHIALGVEIPTGVLSDWLGDGWLLLAIGQDVQNEGNNGMQLEFRYTVTRNRSLP